MFIIKNEYYNECSPDKEQIGGIPTLPIPNHDRHHKNVPEEPHHERDCVRDDDVEKEGIDEGGIPHLLWIVHLNHSIHLPTLTLTHIQGKRKVLSEPVHCQPTN